jgi:hypothetical protein
MLMYYTHQAGRLGSKPRGTSAVAYIPLEPGGGFGTESRGIKAVANPAPGTSGAGGGILELANILNLTVNLTVKK